MQKIGDLGFIVIQNEKPFEFLFPVFFDNMPFIICSFASPILDTLSKQYSQIPEFRIYRIPRYLYNKYSIVEQMMFDSFKLNSALKIIDLNS